MSPLFDGDATSCNHADYWLTTSTGQQILVFTFETPIDVALVRVCATYPSPNRRSNYQITVATRWGKVRQVTEGFVDTANDLFGSFHTHQVLEEGVIEVRFDLTQEGSYGVCLKKIELWAVE
jgi:hypothetical protein